MSPKTKEQFESIRQRSRDTIKQTALELFGRQGYHSTSISAIAKAAGVSKGLMYNYFESKEALLVEIMTEVIATGMQLLDDALAVSEVPFEQLEALLNRTVAWGQLATAYIFGLSARCAGDAAPRHQSPGRSSNC